MDAKGAIRMAKINLERRAEIGQEKRARTRAQLMAAARALFSARPEASITIDDLMREAGLAKGTFYVHFDDMQALTAALADELVQAIDELIQPHRATMHDPLLRMAFGWNAFIEKALEEPAWGALVARMARAYPTVGEVARGRLREDLRDALDKAGGPDFSVSLALEVVEGILGQVLLAFGEGRLSHADRAGAIGALLGAVGVGRREAARILAKVERARGAVVKLISRPDKNEARAAELRGD